MLQKVWLFMFRALGLGRESLVFKPLIRPYLLQGGSRRVQGQGACRDAGLRLASSMNDLRISSAGLTWNTSGPEYPA